MRPSGPLLHPSTAAVSQETWRKEAIVGFSFCFLCLFVFHKIYPRSVHLDMSVGCNKNEFPKEIQGCKVITTMQVG